MPPRSKQHGNIVIALFGAVAAVGVLTLGMQNLIKGPMTTMSKVTKVTMAENQMMAASQMAAVTATTQASDGDCDADMFVEPLPWVDATGDGPDGVAGSDGGGFLPLNIAAMKKDPWNNQYGYCVWDHGAGVDAAGCGGAGQLRLQGTNSESFPSLAIISAGPDKVFQTACRDWEDADTDNEPDVPLYEKASGSDDIIFAQTYGEASASVGGLWRLKSGDPATATIGKDIEVTGGATFSQALAITGGGLLLPDQTASGACNAANSEQLRRNTTSTPSALEICAWDGSAGTWETVSGGGGGASDMFNTDNSVVCDNTTLGQVRFNSTSEMPEYCDGIGWRPFALAIPAVNLIIDPATDNAMNVDGTCGTAECDGATIDFTVTNGGSSTSAVISTALTNTTNFEIVSDTCDGADLDPSEACIVQVKPKATGNTVYSGRLNIAANNNPFAILMGTASGFNCSPGRSGGGGLYVACGLNDGDGAYDLIVMPSGCDGTTTNPTCSGNDGVPTLKMWGPAASVPGVCAYGSSTCKNAQNSQTLAMLQSIGYATYPANEYCQTMTYGGYTDWYLPSEAELGSRIYPAKAAGHLTGFASARYWNSNAASNNAGFVDFPTGTTTASSTGTTTNYVRCVRRHNLALPTAITDSDPDVIGNISSGSAAETWPYRLVTEASGTRLNTITYTPTGFSQMNVSISADGGNPKVKINGGAEVDSGTMNLGQTVQFFMSAPTTPGTEYTATITLGTDTYQLKAAYADPAITLRMFVTNAASAAGGIGAVCTSEATSAGLAGSWNLFAGGGTAMRLSAPWNWGKLERIDGATIADDWDDLWDGTIDNPISITAAGATVSAVVWTGSGSFGTGQVYGNATGGAAHCSGWTSSSGAASGYIGNSGVTNASWISSNILNVCSILTRGYCIQSTAGSDIDPVDVTFGRKVSYTSGTRMSSGVVTITGISSTVSVSVAGASGDPKLKINGGAEVASGTVGLNGTLQVVMDAPTVLGTEYTADVTIGSDTVTYKVGYADSSLVKRVFVSSTGYSTFTSLLVGQGGLNTACTTSANNAGLGGTWKAGVSATTNPAIHNIGWNWGELQMVDGTKIADDWDDLWDGTIDNPINTTELGTITTDTRVWTGSTAAGLMTSRNWTDWSFSTGDATYGVPTTATAGWMNTSITNSGAYPLYCFENSGGTTDTTPNAIDFPYKVQVATSSRQTSDPVTISGLGAGVSADITFTATGGNAKYTVNGGAEQDSGTGTDVTNGDVLRLVMDAPGTDNSSNKMTVTVGGLSNIYWRVWTGDSSGTVVKRVFVSSANTGPALGGVTGGDAHCAARASAAALGGTWRAIMSGILEEHWAINRVGYNWSTLKLVDNTTMVTTAGNLWKADTIPLTNPINKTESGGAPATGTGWANTRVNGKAAGTDATAGCTDWTGPSGWNMGSNVNATNISWIYFTGWAGACNGSYRLYCIEQ